MVELVTRSAYLKLDGFTIPLSPQETTVARSLLQRPMTMDELVGKVYGPDIDGGAESAKNRISVIICYLNNKMEYTSGAITRQPNRTFKFVHQDGGRHGDTASCETGSSATN